jgi:hypothetical protein
MPFPSITSNTPNFPKPLDRNENSGPLVFPNDLTNSTGRNFYTQIQFVQYSIFQQINFMGSYALPSGGMKLPIPSKVNDNLILHWSPVSLTESALGAMGSFGKGAGLVAQLGGAAVPGGLALNPLMFLLFQRPEYRQFSLSWLLTPRNEKESNTIKNIVTKCKRAASPDRFGPFLMTYPQVALIKMYPNDIFGQMIFKPCIITSVQVNYTNAPTPAFHKNGAPAAVALTLNLMEMQFWFRNEIT